MDLKNVSQYVDGIATYQLLDQINSLYFWVMVYSTSLSTFLSQQVYTGILLNWPYSKYLNYDLFLQSKEFARL